MAYTTLSQLPASNTVKASTISSAIEDFDLILGRAAECASRLQKLQTRVHGPRPEEVSGAAKADHPPHSLIASIHERRSRLSAILDDMDNAISSLENGV